MSKILNAIKRHQAKEAVHHDSGTKKNGDGGLDEAESSVRNDTISDSDLKLARIVWKWLIARSQVSVGPDGEWNYLSLDAILEIPEEPPKPRVVVAKDARGKKADAKGDKGKKASSDMVDGETAQDSQETAPIVDNDTTKQAATEVSQENGEAAIATVMPAAEVDNNKGSSSKSSSMGKKLPKFRPRIFVDEETSWKSLTGHGIDFKRVPNLEWKCLIGIGAAREEGILQPDLTKLTRQDKRSVPKRADALANKGYIAKRTVLSRGIKTSRLWLVKFAPPLPTFTGLMNLSKEFLTRDVKKVPWSRSWLGDSIDFVSFGQTLEAIVRAWKTIRIKELKCKLGVLGMRWQMKVMSRQLRRFVAMGSMNYTAASFDGGRHVYKDCIQFIRPITEDEWKVILATGKKGSKSSSQTQKGKGKTKGKKGKKAPIATGPALEVVTKQDMRSRVALTTGWTPEKPLINTVFEFVKGGGSVGYSNPEVLAATVGPSFRRHMFTLLNNTSVPGVQPPHLQDKQMSSRQVRIRKIRPFMYSITGAPASTDQGGQEIPAQVETAQQQPADPFGFAAVQQGAIAEDGSTSLTELSRKAGKPWATERRGARPYQRAKAATGAWGQAKLNAVNDEPPKKRGRPRNPETASSQPPKKRGRPRNQETASSQPPKKRGRPPKNKTEPVKNIEVVDSETSDTPSAEFVEPEAPAPEITVGRASKRRRVTQNMSYTVPTEFDGFEEADAPVARSARNRNAAKRVSYAKLLDSEDESVAVSDDQEPIGKPTLGLPGAYIGEPNSLDPVGKKGRPKKSVVLVIRSDKLKDLNFLSSIGNPDAVSFSTVVPVARASEGQTDNMQIGKSQPGTVEAAQSRPEQSANGDSIVVKEFYSDNESGETQSPEAAAPTPVAKPVETPRTKRKYTKGVSKQENWVCEKCGGIWKNDNGLKYHLENSKTRCNPYYADHPEELTWKTSRKRVRRLSSTPPASEASGQQNAVDRPATPGAPSPSTSVVTKRASTSGAAANRPILKPQSLARRRIPAGPSVTPRGVQKAKLSTAIEERTTASPVQTPSQAVKVPEPPASAPAGVTVMAELKIPLNTNMRAQLKSNVPKSMGKFGGFNGQQTPQLLKVQSAAEENGGKSQNRPQSAELPASTNATDEQSLNSAQANNKHLQGIADLTPESDGSASAPLRPSDGNAAPIVLNKPARKPLPTTGPRRSASSSEFQGASAASTAPQGDGSENTGLPPAFIMPENENYPKMTEPGYKFFRNQEIIKYIVDSCGGAFPGDKSLWLAVSRIYLTELPKEDLPKNPAVHAAVKKLQDEKLYKAVTFAARSETNVWTTAEIVTRYEMEPSDPVSTALKEQMRKAFPDAYIPAAFAPTEDEIILIKKARLEKARKRGLEDDTRRGPKPGRRDHKLVENIAVLNAPYYATFGIKGVRGPIKRRLSNSDDDESIPDDNDYVDPPAKRPRTDGSVKDPAVPELGTPRRGRKRTAADMSPGTPSSRKAKRGRKPGPRGDGVRCDEILNPMKYSLSENHAPNPGLDTLPASFFASNRHGGGSGAGAATAALRFIEPNQDLDEDLEEEVESSESSPSLTAAESQVSELEGRELMPKNQELFTEMIEVLASNSSKGSWPSYDQKWWEKQNCSYTMKGWMPSKRYLLMQNLPHSMDEMANRITSHFQPARWLDPALGLFELQVEGCLTWELTEIGQHYLLGSIAPEYIFINCSSTPAVSNMTPMPPGLLQWRDENEWTLETIPYEKLEPLEVYEQARLDRLGHLDEFDQLMGQAKPDTSGRGRGRGRGRRARGSAVSRGAGRGRGGAESVSKPRVRAHKKYTTKAMRENICEIKYQRELTAYPDRALPGQYFRQQAIEYDEASKEDRAFWQSDNTRISALVAVGTLMGGINKGMDWGLLLRLFPEYKCSNIKKFWVSIKKTRGQFVQDLTEKFQTEFLAAYQDGELPPINFDKHMEYDWPQLVRWTSKLIQKETLDLPPTRLQLNDEYVFAEDKEEPQNWRDEYHNWQRSIFNKFCDATSEPAATALEPTIKQEDNDVVLARSWVRALCATEANKSNPAAIRRKFAGLGGRSEQEVNKLLESTIKHLEMNRIAIKQNSTQMATGRPYRLNEHFVQNLTKSSQISKYTQAAAFKTQLDEAFRRGEIVDIPYWTNDGMIMAILNLQAHGRVRIDAVDAPSNVPYGFKPGFYESRKFPKSHYHFAVRVSPTERYVYNDRVKLLYTTRKAELPGEQPDGKVPLWCDLFGNVDAMRWCKMLGAVLFVLATKGAMTTPYVAHFLRKCCEIWEVGTIRDWALDVGLLKEVSVGGGASVTEWWWLVVGQQMSEAKAMEEALAANAANAAPAEAAAV